jgi:phage terminase small subunit
LTPKQQRFIAEYLIDLNATAAALRAGYSEKTASTQGHENLRKPEIAAAISEGKARQLESADLSAARVLEELRRLALSDARGFWDESGDLKPIRELTAEQGACLAGFEAVIGKRTEQGKAPDVIHKIKLWNKPQALEALAKHFGLLVERVKNEGVQPVKVTVELHPSTT